MTRDESMTLQTGQKIKVISGEFKGRSVKIQAGLPSGPVLVKLNIRKRLVVVWIDHINITPITNTQNRS